MTGSFNRFMTGLAEENPSVDNAKHLGAEKHRFSSSPRLSTLTWHFAEHGASIYQTASIDATQQ